MYVAFGAVAHYQRSFFDRPRFLHSSRLRAEIQLKTSTRTNYLLKKGYDGTISETRPSHTWQPDKSNINDLGWRIYYTSEEGYQGVF
jgi:hypothetical protein